MKKTLYISLIILLLPLVMLCQTIRYASVTGAGSHDGTSEANAWTLSEALANDAPNMTIYLKAGNYGSGTKTFSTSGTAGNPIKYIGYKTTPGDKNASNGSTFNYGDTVSSAEMPLIDNTNGTGIGIQVTGQYVEIHNFQIYRYGLGGLLSAQNSVFNNVVAVDLGNQAATNYDGFGLRMTASNSHFVNCYVENATAESMKITGSENSSITWSEIRADNTTNPTDYYMLLSSGANYNLVENCHVERAAGLSHGGHGLTIKHNSKYNTYRNCTIVYTNIDFNFEDVQYNLAENIRMIGQGTSSAYWHTNIDTRNGANNNTFRNIYATNIWTLITWTDDNDGFTPSPDTDAVKCGYNNTYQNFIVENVEILFTALGNTIIGGSRDAPATGNIIENFTVINYGKIGTFYNTNSGNVLRNSAFKNHTGSIGINWDGTKGDNMTKTTNNFDGTLNHSAYGGTTLASGFVGTGTGVDPYRLTSGSALKDAGTASGNINDYDGTTWGTMGIGAFEYSSGGGDVTAPTVTSVTVSEITDVSARVTWYLDEGATGQLEYGTTTGYGSTTTLETNYLTGHSQVISGLSPSTLYHYNIIGQDAAANNIGVLDRTFTTAADPNPIPEPPLIEGGVKSRFLKFKKF